MMCPSCGNENQTGAKFCSECGTPLSAILGSKQNSSKTGLRDTLIIVGVILSMTFAYFLIRNTSHTDETQKMTRENQDAVPKSHPDMTGMADQPEMKMIDSLPQDYETMVKYGNQFMDEGQFPLGAECYKRALALNPASNDVRVDYGACLHAMGLGDRALQEFRKVLGENPNHPIAIFNVGVVFMDKSMKDSAKSYFTKYLAIDPNGRASEAAKGFLSEISK